MVILVIKNYLYWARAVARILAQGGLKIKGRRQARPEGPKPDARKLREGCGSARLLSKFIDFWPCNVALRNF